MMKKYYKFVLAFLCLFLGLFGFYVYKLHSLALEGNKIFEQRCLVVNPPLIAYKNSFLGFADSLKNPNKYTDDQLKKFFYDYIDEMRKYVLEETSWLETNGKFINRWDFQLIEPWYLKQAGNYQQKMYEGYRDDARYILEVYDSGGTDEELSAKLSDARDRRDNYSQLYFDLSDKASAINDWRKIFGRVPVPAGCNDSNLIIPDTTGAMDAEPTPIPAKEPGITG